MSDTHYTERIARGSSGWPMLGLAVALVLGGGALLIGATAAVPGLLAPLGILAILAGLIMLAGLTPVAPGEARVVQLLGRYVGTVRTDGLRWVNPLTSRRRVSTRIRNHETDVLKVNDADGNPIEMAAVVVWQVDDTAKAVFAVVDFLAFVAIQTETAVRHIAGSSPYDAHDDA